MGQHPNIEQLLEAIGQAGYRVWAKHGVMARSEISIRRAADRVEYAEAAAKYE